MKIQLKIKDQTIPINVGGVQVVDNYDKGYQDGYNASYDIGYKDGETNGYNSAVSKLDEIEITENGEYTPSEDKLGYNKVTVNVPKDITLPIFTGDLSYQFYKDRWNWFIEEYGDKIVTQDVTNCENMFASSSKLTHIPFEINCKKDTLVSLSNMFGYNNWLTNIPKINNCKPSKMNTFITNCYSLTSIPSDFETWFDWSNLGKGDVSMAGWFQHCYSFRQIPPYILNVFKHHTYSKTSISSAYYNSFANACRALDEVINLPIPYTGEFKYNTFSSLCAECNRLKNLTFALQENGQPYVVNWKSQTIDLGTYVGYTSKSYVSYILNWSSGITTETQITDDTTYQLYKNHPDSWTYDRAYSRYNHDSAVATINSLPDTSAYLLANGGTNTIKFRGNSGSKTDGGAINTLTEEEIAVATAKGWTVTFS